MCAMRLAKKILGRNNQHVNLLNQMRSIGSIGAQDNIRGIERKRGKTPTSYIFSVVKDMCTLAIKEKINLILDQGSALSLVMVRMCLAINFGMIKIKI